MTSKYLNDTGLSEVWTNTKNYIASQLLGKSNVGHTHSKSEITDFPNLSTVATSGSYNDLSNKPTIPTVNNATLTIQQNGTTVKTFTANASSNVTANITVPTKTSDLTNDSNFITEDTTKIPLAGTSALAGSIVPSTDNAYNLGDSSHNLKTVYAKEIRHGLNSGVLFLGGGKGANIELYGNNASQYGGWVSIKAADNNGQYQMLLKPDGTLKWGTKNVAMAEDVVPRSGGAVMTGNNLARNINNAFLYLCGGADIDNSSAISIYGKDFSAYNLYGTVRIIVKNPNLNQTKEMQLKPNGTWTWNGTACQITSDQRLKQQITEIDDKLLDAWEDVELSQFKYNDAVDQKGDNARLHTGYVVQQIDSACKSHGVDISAYGLYCHEEYPQETEEVEVEQKDGTKVKETKVIREASEHYSLRYTEALIVECAYLRKCIKELRAEIEDLKSSK